MSDNLIKGYNITVFEGYERFTQIPVVTRTGFTGEAYFYRTNSTYDKVCDCLLIIKGSAGDRYYKFANGDAKQYHRESSPKDITVFMQNNKHYVLVNFSDCFGIYHLPQNAMANDGFYTAQLRYSKKHKMKYDHSEKWGRTANVFFHSASHNYYLESHENYVWYDRKGRDVPSKINYFIIFDSEMNSIHEYIDKKMYFSNVDNVLLFSEPYSVTFFDSSAMKEICTVEGKQFLEWTKGKNRTCTLVDRYNIPTDYTIPYAGNSVTVNDDENIAKKPKLNPAVATTPVSPLVLIPSVTAPPQVANSDNGNNNNNNKCTVCNGAMFGMCLTADCTTHKPNIHMACAMDDNCCGKKYVAKKLPPPK